LQNQLTVEQQDVVRRNLPLVEHIVKRMMTRFPACYDRDDLVQTGVIGLIEASARFDPTKGIAFSTFVGRRIEGAIIDQLRRDDWAPRSVRASERQLDQAETELTRRGSRPDEHELSRRIGLDVAELRRLRARIATASVDSLDRPVGRDDSTGPLAETVADASARSTEGDLDDRELKGYLRDALSLLPERHRIIIVGHFFEGRSMTELGELLGVTQSRASQLKEDALRMVRTAIRDQYLDVDRKGEPAPGARPTKRDREFTESLRRARTWRDRIAPRDSILVG
jgi:RNA polymerase sigma factor FliA